MVASSGCVLVYYFLLYAYACDLNCTSNAPMANDFGFDCRSNAKDHYASNGCERTYSFSPEESSTGAFADKILELLLGFIFPTQV